MSRQKKDRDLFPNGTISEEAMLAYLQGGLSTEEKLQFEKLLADDPFAQEAMDGLKAAQIATVTKSIASVKRQVREISGTPQPKLVKMHWSSYAWAAAVFGMLVGVGFLMVGYLGNKSENIAQNTGKAMDTETKLMESDATPKYESAAPVSDSIVLESVAASEGTVEDLPAAAADKEGETKQSAFVKQPEASAANANGAGANPKTVAPTVTAPTTLEKKANMSSEPATGSGVKNEERNKQTIQQEIKVADNTSAEQIAVTGKKADKQKAKTSQTTVTTKDMNQVSANKAPDIEMAMKNFNDGNYDVSSDQFSTVLKADPSNADALYFGGISDYITNKNAKGEKNFDKLLKGGNRYTEGSKWYKANILLQKGKKEEAKKLLNDLSNSNSSYRERAIKKMAEMEF